MSAKKLQDETFLSRLQPRERVMVVALIAVFFVMAGAVLFFLRASKISEAQKTISSLREGLELLRVQGPAYQEKLSSKASREAQISDEPIVFGTIIERAESVAGVSVSGQEEKTPIDLEGGLRMRMVEFDLRGISLEQLTKFVAEYESEPGRVVLTQELLVRSSSASEDQLNVKLEVATWERVAVVELEED